MKTIFTILLVFILAFAAKAQVNGYGNVTLIQTGNKLIIGGTNETSGLFRKNGLVIVMQMQDNVIGTNILNNINFGDLATIASSGEYEIATIATVKRNDADPDDDDDDNTNPILEIKLTAPLAKTFITGLNSTVQVITFPTLGLGNFTTNANINALPWNGSYGGVIAFEVTGTLTLNHNINADNAGFRGGVMDASSSPYGTCNSVTYFTAVDALFGNKGEGIYKPVNPLFAAGKGKILNGGGGGNTINGGGSGGGNFSAGGNGGAGWSCALNTGGIGGIALNNFIGATRLFLGGGGGSGESNDNSNNKGGNGGGIILIKAQMIRTTGSGAAIRISANGEAGNSVANDGAGGAGAGGSIAFQVNNWNIRASKPLQITANGGNGGNVNDAGIHGGGGGGGQGAILFNSSFPSPNITINTLNGTGGLNSIGGTRANNGAGINNIGLIQNAFEILPLRLLSFSAQKHSGKVDLLWKTKNEINVARFEIQRSFNGTAFNVIGNKQTVASNQPVNSYTFSDEQPSTGANYYRVRMIDNDGKFSYSKVLLITGVDLSKEKLGIFPNPAVSQATLYYRSEKKATATIQVFNMNGALITKQQIEVLNGENALALHGINHFAAGIYHVQLTVDQTSQHTRLIVQK